ncbi:MAG: hypothetical protein NZ923_08840 [Candidatus Kryptonium sp.]|nr:hypothetical protein [Candidatus Kryptonium sp.]
MKRLILTLFFILAFKLNGQTIEENFWVTNGVVWATARDGNLLYFGGTFTQVYRPITAGAVVDRTTGDAIISFPRILSGTGPGTVLAVVSDGAGGWFVGGNFTQVGSVSRTNIVHILPDGSVNLSFLPAGANGIVRALARVGNYLYVGGDFTSIGGVARNRIARINITSGTVDSWYPTGGANASVYSIVPYGGIVYVGGSFITIGGVSRGRIAGIDANTGAVTSFNPDVQNGVVFTMALFETSQLIGYNILYIGGTFTQIGGTTYNRIVALNASTGAVVWYPTGGANAAVNSITLVWGGAWYLIVGGSFTTIAGQTRNYLCAFSLVPPAGTLDPWTPNPSSTVNSVFAIDSEVYVGGAFTSVAGQSRNRVAKFNLVNNSFVLTSWDASALNNSVSAISGYGGRIYVGGNFGGINARARNYIASIDLSTGNLTSWNPGANNNVLSMHIAGGYLFIGGQFTSVAGQSRTRLASFNLSDGTLTLWNPAANGDVRAFASSGSILYVGGAFTSITQGASRARNYLASFNISTGQLTSWNPSANGVIYGLFVSGNHLYVAGEFTTIDGLTRNRLAKFDISTGELLSWAPSANNTVWAVVVQDLRVYVGGFFTTIGGTTRNYIAALDANTGALLSWNPNANNTVYSLAIVGNTIYCGGAFTSIGGAARNYLAGIDINTGSVTSWNPDANNLVYTLLPVVESGRIYVGGQFTQIMGYLNQYLASLTIPDLVDQRLTVGFSINSISVQTSSTGNIVYVRLTWLDRTPPEHGVHQFTFEITSTSISISSASVSIHPSIAGSFTISKTNISGGVRVTITGNTASSLLTDAGSFEGAYLVAVLTFDAPTTDGTYYINLRNISPATIRLVDPPNTASSFPITDGYTTLQVISFTQFPITVPRFLPSGYTQHRKYGDINWDGNIDISDITSIADVVIEKFSTVSVNDPLTGVRSFYGGGANPNGYDGSNPDRADRRSADVYGTGGNGDPTDGEGDDILTQLDLAVIVDAVSLGAWPNYSGVISAVSGKPAYKMIEQQNIENLFALGKISSHAKGIIKFEVFDPGDKLAKVRIKLVNNEEKLRGIQIEFKSSGLPRIEDVWKMPDAAGLNLAWSRNEFNRTVILLYADGGKYLKTGESVLLTLIVPKAKIEHLIESNPIVIASVENISKMMMFDISNTNYDFPSEYKLFPAYPNPFNLEAKIEFDVPEYSSVKLIVWDAMGRKVKTLIDAKLDPGRKVVEWDGRDDSGNMVGSGVYFITMFANSLDGDGKFWGSQKVLLLK